MKIQKIHWRSGLLCLSSVFIFFQHRDEILRVLNFIAFVLTVFCQPALAADDVKAPLPIPRFVTLGADEVNLRTGPGIRYPIRLVIRKDGLPVEVVREFDVWRQVRDRDGDIGWVHKSMLSGKRGVVIEKEIRNLLKKPDPNARPVARLEPEVIAQLKKCENEWCELKIASYEGWMKRDAFWGVYPNEQVGD